MVIVLSLLFALSSIATLLILASGASSGIVTSSKPSVYPAKNMGSYLIGCFIVQLLSINM